MRVKTAGLLDFIGSKAKPTSNAMYEALAKGVSDDYLKSKSDPSASIAKIAGDRGFNDDQIHRVVELANRQINTSLSKTASDQLFTFPAATVESVRSAMKAPKAQKTASIESDGFDKIAAMPDFAAVVAADRFGRSIAMPKVASAEPQVKLPRVAAINDVKAHMSKLAGDSHCAEMDVRQAMAAVRKEWQKVAENPADGREFLTAAAVLMGSDFVPAFAKTLGAEKLLEGFDLPDTQKVAEYLDTQHSAVVVLTRLRDCLKAFDTAKTAEADARQKTAGVKDLAAKGALRLAFGKRSPELGLLGAGMTAAAGGGAKDVLKSGIKASKVPGIHTPFVDAMRQGVEDTRA